MTEKDFDERVKEICAFINNAELDDLRTELKKFVAQYGTQGVFAYGAWCEKNFEANLREDYERKTTYTSDFSIAEWRVPIEGNHAIANTLKSAMDNWKDNIVFFAEIVLVLKKLGAPRKEEHELFKDVCRTLLLCEGLVL